MYLRDCQAGLLGCEKWAGCGDGGIVLKPGSSDAGMQRRERRMWMNHEWHRDDKGWAAGSSSNMTRCSRSFLGLVLIALLALAGSVVDQLAGSQESGPKHCVWGQVRSPRADSFLSAPDILGLVSAAGVPTDNADLTRVVLVQTVAQKRMGVNLRAMLDPGQVLPLAPGDVVIVPTSTWSSIVRGLATVSEAATLVGFVFTTLTWSGIR